MEDVYYIIALVSFALAACSLVACVIIFFRAGVLDAIRFLQHRPMKKPSGTKRSSALRAGSGKKRERMSGQGVRPTDLNRDDETADLFEKTTKDVDQLVASGGSEGETDLLPEDSENSTGLLDDGASERPTGLLGEEESENPTGLLAENSSENPTGLLGEESSEVSTGLLVEGVSECPTGLLDDDSERPTGLLVQEESVDQRDDSAETSPDGQSSSIAQQEETTFRFILKQNVVVVHTQEVIE